MNFFSINYDWHCHNGIYFLANYRLKNYIKDSDKTADLSIFGIKLKIIHSPDGEVKITLKKGRIFRKTLHEATLPKPTKDILDNYILDTLSDLVTTSFDNSNIGSDDFMFLNSKKAFKFI